MKTLPKTILLVAVFSIATLAVLSSISAPVLADSTGTPGQPNQSCETSTASPPGFNSQGFTGPADQHYAGNGQNTQTPANSAAVSQYDVACFQLSQH